MASLFPMYVDTDQTLEIEFATGKVVMLISIIGTFIFLTAYLVYIIAQNEEAMIAFYVVVALLLPFIGALIYVCITAIRTFRKPIIEISPEGIYDTRCFRRPIPWESIRAIYTKSFKIWGYTVNSLLLEIESPESLDWRPPQRWLFFLNRKLGFGENIELQTNMLRVSRVELDSILRSYAEAHHTPVSRPQV